MSDLAAKFKASMAKFEEMQKPQAWQTFCSNPNTKTMCLFDIYHKEIALDDTDIITQHENHCQTLCQLNPKLNSNSWSFDELRNVIEFSRDLWEKKNSEEFTYQAHGALAAVIAFRLFGAADRGFHWKLCFYALGFNPLRDTEKRKEIETKAKDMFKHG